MCERLAIGLQRFLICVLFFTALFGCASKGTKDTQDEPQGVGPQAVESSAADVKAGVSIATQSFLPAAGLGPAGNLIVDGDRFFPIGIYNVPAEDFEVVRSLGFNMVHTYQAEGHVKRVGSAASPDWLAGYLSEAKNAGLRVLMGVPRFAIAGGNLDELSEYFRVLRGQSSLVTWYVYDEPALQGIAPSVIEKVASLARDVDPDNPLALVLSDPTGSHAGAYYSLVDIPMVDPYPYRNATSDLSLVTTEVHTASRLTSHRKPVWAVIQAHGRGDGGKGFGYLEPPYQVLRNMTFQAVAAGARGLYFFAWKSSQFELEKSVSATNSLRKVVAELNEVMPLLLAPSLELSPLRLIATSDVENRVFVVRDETWLLVVNTSHEPRGFRVTPRLGQLPDNVDVPYEGRSVKVTRNHFTGFLPPLGVRFYRMGLLPSSELN